MTIVGLLLLMAFVIWVLEEANVVTRRLSIFFVIAALAVPLVR
jgi:hypothetical protein